MTRSERHDPQDHDELKKEIKEEMKHDARRTKLLGCGGCAILTALIILTPFFIVAFFLAKTGFVEIPLMTNRLYRPTEPVREVTPLVGYSASDIITSIPGKITYEPLNGTTELAFSEQELTTLLGESVREYAKQGVIPFPVSSSQVALEDDWMEVFMITPQNQRDVTVRLRLVPRVEDGSFRLESEEMVVGSLVFDGEIGRLLFGIFGRRFEEMVNDRLDGIGRLEDVTFGDGKIRIIIRPAPGVI